jgi:hypothetical protein
VVNFTPWLLYPWEKELLIPINYEAVWAPELVWAFWRRYRTLAPARI